MDSIHAVTGVYYAGTNDDTVEAELKTAYMKVELKDSTADEKIELDFDDYYG